MPKITELFIGQHVVVSLYAGNERENLKVVILDIIAGTSSIKYIGLDGIQGFAKIEEISLY